MKKYTNRLFFVCFLALAALTISETSQASELLWFTQVGQLPPQIKGDLTISPATTVKNQTTELSLVSGDIEYSIPVWRNDSNDFSFLGKFQLTSLDTGAVLPDSNVPLPHRFWDIKFGPAYRHKFDNNWVFGAFFEGGSASDEPFANYHNLTMTGNAFLRIPAKKNDSWMVMINYQNNREFLPHIPLPFGGYLMNRRYLRAFFGIPLFMHILPEKTVSYEIFYAPIAVVKAKINTKVSRHVKFITGFNWNNYRYFRDVRAEKKDRLFYYEKRAYGGIEIAPNMRAKASLCVGYSFNKMIFESQSFLDRYFNRINIDPGPYAKLELSLMLVSKKRLSEEMEKYKRNIRSGAQEDTLK